MKTWVLIVIVILALATVAIWTFATATLYRRGQCRTYPYYWCDTNWACCGKDSSNANCIAAGGTTGGSYKITDKYYGSNNKGTSLGDDDHNQYHDLCIAPANAYIAANPGSPLNCLYDPDLSLSCSPPLPYTNDVYSPTNLTGFRGRCYYYSVDDAPDDTYDPNSSVTYSYLPGYPTGSNLSGNYLQQPYIGSGTSPTNNTNYYFAGNSGPQVGTPTNGFANGPNQADSTNYSAWNRLGKLSSGPP
jgi:hypothetical protein